MKLMRDDDRILEKVRRIQEKYPNFYITGNSVPALEKLSLEIVRVIKEEKRLSFKGVVPYFTIKMPYFSDQDTARNFLARIKESYSIARDCYDSYEGIIIVEMAEEWSKKGSCSLLHMFLSYVQSYETTCFIVLVPGKEKKETDFYSEFIQYGIWMKIKSQTPSVKKCVEAFETTAILKGFKVSKEASMLLQKNLEERTETDTENYVIVQQLIKQIIFNRNMEDSENRMIEEKDIMISNTGNRTSRKKIGFVVEHE